MFMWLDAAAASVQRTRINAEHLDCRSWLAPGTCGEFIQGRLDGTDFLINSPIDRYSRATLRRTTGPGIRVINAAARSKVVRALELLSTLHGLPDGLELSVSSDLPQGKGMASSTADIVAAVGAAMAYGGLALSYQEIAQLLIAVEPSDCTHVLGVGHVGHLCGTVFGQFQAPANMRVIVVDCGGIVDTVGFDRARAHFVYARHETLQRNIRARALRGLVSGDETDLAGAATMSARLSQHILPKVQFDDLLAITRENGGLGVNCAHSGSVLGLLYRPDGSRGARLRQIVEATFGQDVTIIGDHKFISGGIDVHARH